MKFPFATNRAAYLALPEWAKGIQAMFDQGCIWIGLSPEIGEGTMIGEFSTIQDKDGIVFIGENCDIGERVSINCSDSHLRCIGLSDENEYLPITIENNVYIGAGSIILGNCHIGHHSVIGAGTVLHKNTKVPPYSLVLGGAQTHVMSKEGYYANRVSNTD